MAVIRSLSMMRLPNVQHTGTRQRVHTAMWHAVTDEALPGDHVLALAQELTGQLPGNTKRVPQTGELLAMDNGVFVPGLFSPLLVQAWVDAGSGRYADGGALALDFNVEPMQDGYSCDYRITVTFRAPQASRFERKAFIDQFTGGLATLPTAPTTPKGGAQLLSEAAVVDALQPTVSIKPREYHVEYVTKEDGIREVYPVTPAGQVLGNVKVPLRNPNGVFYPPLPDVDRIMVVTAEQLVPDDQFAHALNAVFHRTMNSGVITFQGQNIAAYHARWLGAESSRTVSEGGKTYKVLSYRIEINNAPYFERIPARGPWFKKKGQGSARFVQKDEDGFPMPGDYPLTSQGFLAESVLDQHVDVVTRYKPKAYRKLLADA